MPRSVHAAARFGPAIVVRAQRPRLTSQVRLLLRATLKALRQSRTRPSRASARDDAALAAHWESTIDQMLRRAPAAGGNAITMYCDGDALLDDFWAAIESARRRAWVESYTIEKDRVGLRTIELLAAAAQRGLDVILFFDGLGSRSLDAASYQSIIDAGGRVCVWNPPRLWWRLRRSPLQRNHRKLAVIDDAFAFLGGMNLSEDYAGPRHGRGTFRDCHLRIEGPAVALLERSMAGVLCGGDTAVCPAPGALPASNVEKAGDAVVQVLESAGRAGRRQIQRELRTAILAAERSIDIATPYFVPPKPIYHAMKTAARRGVRVRLLTAGRSDVPIVSVAARHVYDQLLHRGVRVFELDHVTLHAKTMVVDGVYSMVGSFNLDTWSDKRNLELKVGVIEPGFVTEMSKDFESLILKAREITLETHARRSPWRRAFEWAAYQVMRL